ncbi:MAG: four helix bundle protein [Chloroflexota bacterium]|nr:four helix bundle protein [Chloroflexota bacterium]
MYRAAFEAAMQVFELTRSFPAEERYALVDQVRRSSRSVCMNIAEAWRKRRYPRHFASKLSDSEAEAAETQVSLEFALRCGYIDQEIFDTIDDSYDKILAQLVTMGKNPEKWTIRR